MAPPWKMICNLGDPTSLRHPVPEIQVSFARESWIWILRSLKYLIVVGLTHHDHLPISWPIFENMLYFCRALLQKRPSNFSNRGLVVTMWEPHTMKSLILWQTARLLCSDDLCAFLSLSLSHTHVVSLSLSPHTLSLFLCRPHNCTKEVGVRFFIL